MSWRRHNVLLVNSSSRPAWGSSYTVNVFEPGAYVSGAQTLQTFIPTQGINPIITLNNKVIFETDASTFRQVTATSSSGIIVNQAVSVADNAAIVNLGADTGTTAPNYDGSPLSIYSDPDLQTTLSNAKATSDSLGEYTYYTSVPTLWELIRTSAGTVTDLITDIRDSEPHVVRPEDFGALGDGSTDDANAIQQAVNKAKDLKGRLIFTGGKTYSIRSGIDVDSANDVVIDGNGATIQFPSGLDDEDLLTSDGTGSMFRMIDCNRVKVQDITLNGNLTNRDGYRVGSIPVDSLSCGIWMERCSGITVERCHIFEQMEDGIWVRPDRTNNVTNVDIRIKDNIIERCRRASIVASSANRI
jgi:hypothetical protein